MILPSGMVLALMIMIPSSVISTRFPFCRQVIASKSRIKTNQVGWLVLSLSHISSPHIYYQNTAYYLDVEISGRVE